MCHHGDVGVHVGQAFPGRIQLGASYVLGAMQNLSLQIRGIDLVEVDEAECADSRRGEVEREGRPEPSSPHQQDPRIPEAQLTLFAHLRQGQMPRIPTEL